MNSERRSPGGGTNGAPLYRQIAAELWERIQSGGLRPGERLPSETELAERFGVTRLTLRQAVVELQKLGAVEIRRGIGTFVVDPPDLVEIVASVPSARQSGDTTAAAFDEPAGRHRSARPVRRVDEQIVSFSPAEGAGAREAAAHLGVDDSGDLLRLDTVMARSGRRWIVNSYWFDRRWERVGDLIAVHGLVVPSFVEGLGLDLRYLWRAFSATGADFLEAELLGVPTGSALLVRDGVSAAGDEPVFYVRRRLRGDEAKFVLRYDSTDED